MRKLDDRERRALDVLNRHGSVCPADDGTNRIPAVLQVLDALVKKKRARVEMTDGGPRYWPLTDA